MPVKTSPSLPDLQSWMKSVLVHPGGVAAALKSRPGFMRVIGETSEVSREDRLSIYGEGYFLRIVDCLGANFNSLKATIGDHAFSHLGRRYLNKHPSTFKCIDDIGHRMSEFLQKDPLTRTYPFLPDYAALEWAAHQSFYAEDLPLLNPESLKGMSESRWQKARLVLDPSVRLLDLNWPLDILWRADGKVTARRLKSFKKEPVRLLVFRRPDKSVVVPRVNDAEFFLLKSFQEGRTLGQSLLALAKKRGVPPSAEAVQAWFGEWIRKGVVRKVTFDKSY